MSQLRKYPFAYLGALCGLLALGFFFLPLVYATGIEGSRILVYGYTIAAGGEVVVTIGESLYSMSFSPNILALVLTMCLLLSAVASLLSKESVINRSAAAALAAASAVMIFVLPNQIGQTGLKMAYGSYLCAGTSLLGVLFDLLAFFIHPKKA